MNTTPPEQLTDAEINKLMNEHDDGLCPRPYATCLDAAVGWLGRRGFMWSRVGGRVPYVGVFCDVPDEDTKYAYESPTCTTARALCNAGLEALRAQLQAKESA